MDWNEIKENWEEIRQDREKLLKVLQEAGSQSELSRQTGIPRRTIGYWTTEKHNIDNDEYMEYKGTIHAEEKEKKPDYVKTPDGYYIIHHKGEKRVVEKDTVDRFRELYCEPNKLSKKQCQLELEVSREKLNAMWSAFDITHDDVPVGEEELKNGDLDEIAKEKVQKSKKILFRKMEYEQNNLAQRELKKYYKKDFFLDKALDKLKDYIEKVDYTEPLNIVPDQKKVSLVINLADWHYGKLVEAGKLLDNSIVGYDRQIFNKRFEKVLEEVKRLVQYYKPEKIYILNFGDALDNPNFDTYINQILNQEVSAEKQFMEYLQKIIEFILFVHNFGIDLHYSGVPGNHSSGAVNWDALANSLLGLYLEEYDDIEMDIENKKFKVKEIYDHYIIQCHGEDIRSGKYTGKVDVMNMISMAGLPKKQSYVVHGHEHHDREEGAGYKRIKLPSMVGGDDLSSDIMNVSSRAAQAVFIMDETGLSSEHFINLD